MEFAKNFAASKAHHKEHFWTVCLEPFTPEFLPKLTTTSPAFGLYGWSLSPRNSPKSSPRGTLLDCMFRAFHSGTPPKAHHKEHFWTVCLEPFTPELPQKLTTRNTFGLYVSSLSLRNSPKSSPPSKKLTTRNTVGQYVSSLSLRTLLDPMSQAFHSGTPPIAHHTEHFRTLCFDERLTPEPLQKLTTRNSFAFGGFHKFARRNCNS